MNFILQLIEHIMCAFGIHDWRADIWSRNDDQRFCPTCKSIGTLDRRSGKVQITGKRRVR